MVSARPERGDWDIGIFDPASGEVRWLAQEEASEFRAAVSPYGRWVAYASDRSGESEV